jgi:small ubiquitin-related modifier
METQNSQAIPPPQPPPSSDEGPSKAEPISIKVTGADGSEVHFRLRPTAPLEKLFAAYCERQAVGRPAVRFMYDGVRIRGTETPQLLQMADGDVIDAHVEQTGGGTG